MTQAKTPAFLGQICIQEGRFIFSGVFDNAFYRNYRVQAFCFQNDLADFH